MPPRTAETETKQRRVGRVAMQRIANPCTSVRLRDAPPSSSRCTVKSDAGWSSLVARRLITRRSLVQIQLPQPIFTKRDATLNCIGDISSAGRARPCQGRGHEFEPRMSLQVLPTSSMIDVTDAGWSSLVARRAHNPKVGGSNPPPATNFRLTKSI